jgi:uncharacterized protein (TIGR03435 family)
MDTKKAALAAGLVLALTGAAVLVKLWFFPSIKDGYFAMDNRSLWQAPKGLVVLRPTRFPFLRRNGVLDDGGRLMGRNVTLREVLATAYSQDPSRVWLPLDAPAGRFDFLVTVAAEPRNRLQADIRRELGYTARKEQRDTEALALKIVNAGLPGLTVSRDDEKGNIRFDDVELHFTHVPVSVLADVLGQILPLPVVDKTGLTNFYDFALAWDTETRRQLDDETTARAVVDKFLNRLGLGLEPDTASLEMLVTKRL